MATREFFCQSCGISSEGFGTPCAEKSDSEDSICERCRFLETRRKKNPLELVLRDAVVAGKHAFLCICGRCHREVYSFEETEDLAWKKLEGHGWLLSSVLKGNLEYLCPFCLNGPENGL